MSVLYLQNVGNGNAYATVNGLPQPGEGVICEPFMGAPAQQWLAAQYPGTDPSNGGGVVFALYSAENVGAGLVLTAGPCQQPVTLQPFQQYNLSQLWSYAGPGGVLVNLATGCMLDSNGGAPGANVQTWPQLGNVNQSWSLLTESDARHAADAAAEVDVAAPRKARGKRVPAGSRPGRRAG
ncbi:MAG: RICIN domain-containing protein [Longimicrobiaceae bacterium]